ncbi:unnamed protein product [Rotaria socialis]|uniref:NAD(P)(+)--arginine ADP-ribosyltransferase n=3 Tax=Rotaria socialis TaxID=392032 RepID=A0A818EHG6_9BILA|nr:unnamed protein product [Rotaria socialis]CAF4334886.1 unnamed protein product [Rotaria socialis]
MDCINHSKRIVNPKSRRTLVIGHDVSLIMIENTSTLLNPEDKDLYLSFLDECLVSRYTDLSPCIKYFKKASSREHIILLFLAFDKSNVQKMVSQLDQYEQLQAIFILLPSGNENSDQHKMNKNNGSGCSSETRVKLIKSFYEWKPLSTDLHQHIIAAKSNLKDVGLFSVCSSPETALRDLRRELGSFVWTHTFRVLLVAMPHNSQEAKRQMLKECRKFYKGNPSQNKKIDEFEKTYQASNAIRWYTEPCFLSTLVNKNLRSENVHALYLFRYFIFDLCASLAEARYTHATPISVYRGTILRRDEVEQLRIGSLVSTNGFLSSSRCLEVALSFICSDPGVNMQISRNRNDPEQFSLFKIGIDINLSPDIVVADISNVSHIPDENEFLFDLGTTFVVTNIFYDGENFIWNIQMTASNQVAQLNREYDSYMRERLSETNAAILFGRMLAHLSEYSLAIKYFQRLIRVLPIEHEDRPNLHYQLARMYRFLGKHNQAIHYFRCAKLLQRRALPHNSYEYGMTLAGLGTVYLELNDSKRAVRILEEASVCYNLVSRPYNTETMFHFNRLSYAYYLETQYERALKLLNATLAIYKQKMPADHPGHAQAYHNLGLVHRAMGNSDEALTAFKDALRMRQALLAPNHPYIARTYFQMGLLFEECKDYDAALECARKALNIQELKLPSNHNELILSSELVGSLLSKTNVAM